MSQHRLAADERSRKLESGVHTNPTIGTINRYLHALGKRLVVSIVDEVAAPPVAVGS